MSEPAAPGRAEIVAILAAFGDRPPEEVPEGIDSMELAWLVHQIEQRYGSAPDDEAISRMTTVSAVLHELATLPSLLPPAPGSGGAEASGPAAGVGELAPGAPDLLPGVASGAPGSGGAEAFGPTPGAGELAPSAFDLLPGPAPGSPGSGGAAASGPAAGVGGFGSGGPESPSGPVAGAVPGAPSRVAPGSGGAAASGSGAGAGEFGVRSEAVPGVGGGDG